MAPLQRLRNPSAKYTLIPYAGGVVISKSGRGSSGLWGEGPPLKNGEKPPPGPLSYSTEKVGAFRGPRVLSHHKLLTPQCTFKKADRKSERDLPLLSATVTPSPTHYSLPNLWAHLKHDPRPSLSRFAQNVLKSDQMASDQDLHHAAFGGDIAYMHGGATASQGGPSRLSKANSRNRPTQRRNAVLLACHEERHVLSDSAVGVKDCVYGGLGLGRPRMLSRALEREDPDTWARFGQGTDQERTLLASLQEWRLKMGLPISTAPIVEAICGKKGGVGGGVTGDVPKDDSESGSLSPDINALLQSQNEEGTVNDMRGTSEVVAVGECGFEAGSVKEDETDT